MLLNTLINTNKLNELLEQENTVILDCRFYLTDHSKGQSEYEKGHVPNAIFVDVHRQLAGEETELTGRHPLPEESIFADQLQVWGINQDSRVVVYDDMSGAIAARAWWMLTQQGIEVYVLDGGIPAWREQGFSITTTLSLGVASDHRFDVAFPWSVTENQVIGNFETGFLQLIDARASDRFNGENEAMDPIAGHIPGAINRPFSENLDINGLFKAKDVLQKEWQALLSENDECVYYCGSGVTACHNVLALNYAGMPAQSVYVGSWSQWSKCMLRAANLDK